MVVATTETCWNVVWLYDKSFESLYVYIGGSDLDNNFVDTHSTSNTVKLCFVSSNWRVSSWLIADRVGEGIVSGEWAGCTAVMNRVWPTPTTQHTSPLPTVSSATSLVQYCIPEDIDLHLQCLRDALTELICGRVIPQELSLKYSEVCLRRDWNL